jgi:hypothetical protein
MEYVDGGDTLEDVVARNVARSQLAGRASLPGLAFQRARYCFQQLLGALAAPPLGTGGRRRMAACEA